MQMNSLLLFPSHNWNEILIPHLWVKKKNPYGNWLCSHRRKNKQQKGQERGQWGRAEPACLVTWLIWFLKKDPEECLEHCVSNLDIFFSSFLKCELWVQYSSTSFQPKLAMTPRKACMSGVTPLLLHPGASRGRAVHPCQQTLPEKVPRQKE